MQNKRKQRAITYNALSKELALLSNQTLLQLLEQNTFFKTSTGGATTQLIVNDQSIFVKKIPLTDIENQPEHFMSTKNLFNLPTYYQYGIGSLGFGAWRELATHIMSTNWVLTGECPNFPLMYHWRLLPKSSSQPRLEQVQKLEQDVEFWDNDPSIRARIEATLNASFEIVLFLESFSENLDEWFPKQLRQGNKIAEAACAMIDNDLAAVTTFMISRNLIHFDAHFWNILTDGERLYFSDFGLAISRQFELTETESTFFNTHYHYDQCSTLKFFVQWALNELCGEAHVDTQLDKYTSQTTSNLLLSPKIHAMITRYAPITLAMNTFYKKLKQDKTIPYPAHQLEQLLLKISDAR